MSIQAKIYRHLNSANCGIFSGAVSILLHFMKKHNTNSCECIRIAMDIINSYCKPQQRADRWKMSENSKLSEKYLRENGPGAASAQGRKSKFWHNTPNEWLGKVPKFHGASANGFWYRSEKPPGGDSPPPPVIGLTRASFVDKLHLSFPLTLSDIRHAPY